MNSQTPPERWSALAALVLLELFDQALHGERRLGEVSDHTAGGRPEGRPPAGVLNRALAFWEKKNEIPLQAFEELSSLVRKWQKSALTPSDERRVAELLEVMNLPDAARIWWEKAAKSGDEDAKDYLEVLHEEQKHFKQVTLLHARIAALRHKICEPREPEESQENYWREEVGKHLTKSELSRFFAEIEQFLANPDQVADGGRIY
ncbi:hypothetical protein [Streptomyces thermoalcalitolerans]|uniref:Uncharacterized protein n=1 Tax=Streptomyces thermoalcalitolerans TaxID=65605 RepID=A0ABN1PA70_9ACTN